MSATSAKFRILAVGVDRRFLSICETNFGRKLIIFFLKERAKNLEQGKLDSFTASFLIDYSY